MHILVVEDNEINALQLERILKKEGYSVTVTTNGADALEALRREKFDALITDWLMPNMDGIELIRRAQEFVNPMPVTIVVTVLASVHARRHALSIVGIDEFITKPYEPKVIASRLKSCLLRYHQPEPQALPDTPPTKKTRGKRTPPPCIGVGIATSTGGPMAIRQIMGNIKHLSKAAVFIVQHGPTWMMETFVDMLNHEAPSQVFLAEHGMPVTPGCIYVAPGETHMMIDPKTMALALRDDPPENYAKPSADPLFRSVAKTFGEYCMAVILTGLGRDGARGAADIAASGGIVLAQTPESCAAPYMPQTAIKLGVVTEVVTLEKMAHTISDHIHGLFQKL